MSETRTEITDEELAEFTTRLSRLNTHMGREGGGLQEVAYRYLLRMVRRRAPGLPQDLAEAGADFRAAHARLFDLAQSQEEHRYLLGDTDILPGHADPALEHVAIPVQPGAVVRVGIPSQVFVRDSKACGSGSTVPWPSATTPCGRWPPSASRSSPKGPRPWGADSRESFTPDAMGS